MPPTAGEKRGDLGNGSVTTSDVPVAVDTSGVLAGKTLAQISSGGNFTCALDDTSGAYCWGDGNVGQLGDGDTAVTLVPVAVDTSGVLAGTVLSQISAGWGGHVCVMDSSGAGYCWGYNYYGQLGHDVADEMSTVAVTVGPSPPAGVTAVPGDTTASVSWAPPSLIGGSLSGYTATASPGGQTCTTTGATACTITGLADGSTYQVSVVAHATNGDSAPSAAVSVTPSGQSLAITSPAANTAAFGIAFSFTVTTTGYPPPALTERGSLPPGIAFIDNGNGTATLSGTPFRRALGVYPLTLTAKNKSGTATQAFTLTITKAPVLRKIPATRAHTGAPVNRTITAKGYPTPTLTEQGALPGGLSFADQGNGKATITGTPAPGTGGRYRITVTAANPLGTATRAFTMKVDQAPAITSADSATAQAGSGFSFHLTTTGYPAPRITEAGSLPRGVRFRAASAALSGTPKPGTAGTYPITFTATSAAGTATQNFVLTVTN